MQEKKITHHGHHIIMPLQASSSEGNETHYTCEVYSSQKMHILTFLVRVSLHKFYSIALDLEKNEWMLLMKKDNEDLFEKLVEKLQKVYDII